MDVKQKYLFTYPLTRHGKPKKRRCKMSKQAITSNSQDREIDKIKLASPIREHGQSVKVDGNVTLALVAIVLNIDDAGDMLRNWECLGNVNRNCRSRLELEVEG